MSHPIDDPDSQPGHSLTIKSAAVSDRGLNEKRPLNEDSFLADSERGIFAVADGVGGAEAGEVASQTAIEVLDEAFRHQLDGADIEDLMELAIQRANASIHQMAQDHPKFAMMATTVVGLHVKGNIATIGHVGDSRLYRLTPAGQLLRETEDHSVVEEEVRAGRMTAEQAANHPSKNVISRALGAENAVEVDMKVIEVDDGTEFLLCTDGITRHIPDRELRQLLLSNDNLPELCEELKRRCYERGAEDNLTAVLVCVGQPISPSQRMEDLDKTISPETVPIAAATADVPELRADRQTSGSENFLAPGRKAFPGHSAVPDDSKPSVIENRLNIHDRRPEGSGSGHAAMRLLVFLLLVAAVAAAFYAGRRYKGLIPYVDETQPPLAVISPVPTASQDVASTFEKRRGEVDSDPVSWLTNQVSPELSRQGIQTPLQSTDPQFLYLYGRATLLAGNYEDAGKAFEAAIAKATDNSSAANESLRKEAVLGLAAVALKSEKDRPAAQTRFDEIIRVAPQPSISRLPASSPAGSAPATPTSSP
jgi:protein phosphatase